MILTTASKIKIDRDQIKLMQIRTVREYESTGKVGGAIINYPSLWISHQFMCVWATK